MPQLATDKLVEALLKPEAYPHHPTRVELAQTQMSLVFMTGRFAYKVKKPVNLGYVDYTTLEKRLQLCEQEVILNRRLCPEVYLGLVSVSRQGDRLVMEGKGEAVEYAVKMLQLPRHRMMDVLLEKGQVTREMVKQVADRMARFHSQAETSPAISAFGSLEAIRTNTEENFSQTEKYVGQAISAEQYDTIREWTREFTKTEASLFERRARGGRIRDCHGDLHAAHICFTDGICIYDCIEFNDRFRYCDVASEIAFLAMDIDFHRRPGLSGTFTKAYMERAGDKYMGELLGFYKIYRAYVRGKVECFSSEDGLAPPAEREKALRRAQAYFDLASSYISSASGRPRQASPLSSGGRELERGGAVSPADATLTYTSPVKGEGVRETPSERRNRQSREGTAPLRLFITVGMVGTGKTALAEALSKELGLTVLSSDVIRKNLAAVPLTEHRYEEFNIGVYSADFTRRTYDALFDEADRLLAEGKSVILDASFKKAEARERAQQVARLRGADLWTIEVTCPEDVVRRRLEQRLRQPNVPSDGRWEIYLAQKRDFEPVEPGPHHIRVDSSQPLARMVEEILSRLSGQRKASASRRGR